MSDGDTINYGPRCDCCPRGHVEEGESLVDACARELKEELALDCTRFRFVD